MKQFQHFLKQVRNKVNESSETPSKLRSVTVKYADGTVINTNMAAHLTDEDIRNYYKVGKLFNLGNKPVPGEGSIGDNMQPVESVTINENVNEAMNRADLINILHNYTVYLMKHVDSVKLPTDAIPTIINNFLGVSESLDTGYNVMVVKVPPVEEWYDMQISSIIGDTCKSFRYMDKTYSIRPKDIQLFTDNVGKDIKFKYMKNDFPMFMEFPALTNNI